MIHNILHISDTHGHHRQLENLPDADVIVHTGDVTEDGTEEELLDFLEWFRDLPYRYKVFIAGNHDSCLYGTSIEGLDENCYYLYGNSVIIEGVKFYGIPMLPGDILSGRYAEMIEGIPEDTDILLTHQPPLGILDEEDYPGDVRILSKVLSVKPQFHLVGHNHDSYGRMDGAATTFVNGSLADRQCMLEKHPVLIEFIVS